MRPNDAPPPIEQLAVIGDRRSAAMLDEQGTIVWLCLPWYNDPPALASLLDQQHGGHWSVSCEAAAPERHYAPREPVHRMRWMVGDARIELSDFMPFPETDRPTELADARLVVRHLRCEGAGSAELAMHLMPAPDLDCVDMTGGAIALRRGGDDVAWLLGSHSMHSNGSSVSADVRLGDGDEAWFVLGAGPRLAVDTPTVREWLDKTIEHWREWRDGLEWPTERRERIEDSAVLLHLLSCAPAGAPLAAPTTSLPERIGGDRNYDYRYAWIRDASLTLAALSMLGKTGTVEAYIDWICTLGSGPSAPLQVVYRFDGGTDIPERTVDEFEGYAGSSPVRTGNRAHEQFQLDSLGYFADCTLRYLQAGGEWAEHYWPKLHDSAEWTCGNWREPDHGIWELPAQRHWTSSKVMSWTVLDRVIRICELLGRAAPPEKWVAARQEIHEEVLDRGWDGERQRFRQHYGSSAVDGSLLLIPYMGFLPADDPRVVSTVEAIREELEENGLVYRFDPARTPGSESDLAMGEFEGGFLVCTFWLASFLAQRGSVDEAELLLRDIERASPTGLFAEQMDPRSKAHLGNTPLLFSHAEYLRARADIRERLEADS